MNPDTGELRALRRGEKLPEGFEELPRAMDRDISRVLSIKSRPHTFGPGGDDPAPRVDLTGRGRLQHWAKKKRKAKIAAASRRRNRK
jgi:hypothetical protein